MRSNSDNNFEYLDLAEFLKNSRLLKPYKESISHFYAEQFLIAIELWNQGKSEEALPIFDDVYAVYPHFFIHKFIRLSKRLSLEDPEIILKELEGLHYSKFNYNLDKFLFLLLKASAQFKLFDMDDCIETCEKAIELITDFTPIYLILADSLVIRYRFSEAVKYYKKVLKLGNYMTDNAKANLAYSYLRLNKNWKARRLFCKIVDTFPTNYKIQYNMALCYVRNRDYKKALVYLNNTESLNPEFSGSYLTKGGVYLKLNMPTEAIEAFKKAELLGNNEATKMLNKLSSNTK